ncbi:hypothetical protein VNO78_28341 [Psophocarpus tetragonolobus]|uniref:Sororin C-terminal region domain-containing protein n=1 Tax=Psophocarpus tetragonolobus TaxID=3891 RepID=A0AAN9S2I5_PSOTE
MAVLEEFNVWQSPSFKENCEAGKLCCEPIHSLRPLPEKTVRLENYVVVTIDKEKSKSKDSIFQNLICDGLRRVSERFSHWHKGNVEMEKANSVKRRRNPLSDLTNSNPTKSNPLPSSSSSSINSTCGTVGLDAYEPISAFCNRMHTLNQKKRNTKKAIANPNFSTIPNKNDGVELEGLDLPKARLLTGRCQKKRRAVSYEQNVSKDAQLQDYIEKQRAYYKEIDEFELPEEEVESVRELD